MGLSVEMYIVSEVKFCRCQFVDANLETEIHMQRFADREMGMFCKQSYEDGDLRQQI